MFTVDSECVVHLYACLSLAILVKAFFFHACYACVFFLFLLKTCSIFSHCRIYRVLGPSAVVCSVGLLFAASFYCYCYLSVDSRLKRKKVRPISFILDLIGPLVLPTDYLFINICYRQKVVSSIFTRQKKNKNK